LGDPGHKTIVPLLPAGQNALRGRRIARLRTQSLSDGPASPGLILGGS
jgi:hypothetical protein